MRHEPRFKIEKELVTFVSCSCGWQSNPAAGDSDDQLSMHIALMIAEGPAPKQGPATLAERAECFAAYAVQLLRGAFTYRDIYGEASFQASGHETAISVLSNTIDILTGRKQDLEPEPMTQDDLVRLRELADQQHWPSDHVNEIGELLPKLIAAYDQLDRNALDHVKIHHSNTIELPLEVDPGCTVKIAVKGSAPPETWHPIYVCTASWQALRKPHCVTHSSAKVIEIGREVPSYNERRS